MKEERKDITRRFRLDSTTDDLLQALAAEYNTTMSEILRQAILVYAKMTKEHRKRRLEHKKNYEII